MSGWIKRLSGTRGSNSPLIHDFPADRSRPASIADGLPDADLEALNALMPWSAFTLDRHGRRFGAPHSVNKRSEPQLIPDPRIVELDRRCGLRGARVLEIGCFEGMHTVGLAHLGATVTAVDSRIENVAKTAIRCAMYRAPVALGCWDVEQQPPGDLDLDCDVLHHVGVLYHLVDPIAHLKQLLPRVKRALMLDTHVAPENGPLKAYQSAGRSYRFHEYAEGGRKDPFSGMYRHSRWLVESDLIDFLSGEGWQTDVAEHRAERNGPRVLIFAQRLR